MAVSVLQYNILLDELSNNFVPRTMEEPAAEVLAHAFNSGTATVTIAERWNRLKAALVAEYKQWHPLKLNVRNRHSGQRLRARQLWSERDLLQVASNGWDLAAAGLGPLDSQRVCCASGAPELKTFYGVLVEHLGNEGSCFLYNAIKSVQDTSRSWNVRGPRILQRITAGRPTLVVLEEYDVHHLPTADRASFREAMADAGYYGFLFLGPGQETNGLAIFWLAAEATLQTASNTTAKQLQSPSPSGGSGVATDNKGTVPCGTEFAGYGNADLQEPGVERSVDRRPLAWVRLLIHGKPLCIFGTHLMTSSRDSTGAVRAFELAKIRTLAASLAQPGEAVLFCGDFNIDSRDNKDAHIWAGENTGFQEDTVGVRRLLWQRSDGSRLALRDAYGDIAASTSCSSTRTGSRLETIDYIFYDEALLAPVEGSRTPLKCPEVAMPNEIEPSDHIPISVTFQMKEATVDLCTTVLALEVATPADSRLCKSWTRQWTRKVTLLLLLWLLITPVARRAQGLQPTRARVNHRIARLAV
jgi:endonuclease/exonuclease/phosphatase family metal-dependent hydrolase